MNSSHFIGRNIERKKILDALKTDSEDSKEIINIYGIGGVGKTTLLNRVLDELLRGNEKFVYFKVNEDLNYDNLPTFVSALSKTIASHEIEVDKDFEKLNDIVSQYLVGTGEIEAQLSEEEKEHLESLRLKMNKIIKRNKGKRKYTAPSIKIGKFKTKEADAAGVELNLGEMTGAEKDNKLAYEALKKQYEEKEQEYIDSKGKDRFTKELIKNPIPKLTGAFVEGLKESLYPKFIWRKNKTLKPIKLIIIIDTYEKVSEDVNDWLLEFVNEINKQKENYDFRLLISGRESLRLSDSLSRWDNFKNVLLEKDIKRFNKEELLEYLVMEGINKEKYDSLLNDTDGLPLLVDMWCKNNVLGSSGCNYLMMEDRIFWWKDDKQKEWIRASAFLDYINIDALKLYFNTSADEVFDYLKNCHEACRQNENNSEEWILHPIIKNVLLKSTKQRSPNLYDDYVHKSELFKNIVNLFPDTIGRMKLLNLALFNHFNQTAYSVISEIESFSINDFVNENNTYFNKNKYSYSLKPEFRNLLLEYYNIINPEEVKQRLEVIRKKWCSKKMELTQGLNSKIEEQKNLETKIIKLRKELEESRDFLVQIENQSNSAKIINNQSTKIERSSYPKIKKLAIIALIFSIILCGLNILLFNSVSFIYVVSILFITVAVVFYFKKPDSNLTKSKNDLHKITTSEKEIKIESNKSRISDLESDILKYTEMLNNINFEINDYKDILSENYTYV